jgi:DNA-binding NarL/FixJ family response regulator
MAKGLSNKEIGATLSIAEDTVKIHTVHIFRKLNVNDRIQAVLSASQRGIIQFHSVITLSDDWNRLTFV